MVLGAEYHVRVPGSGRRQEVVELAGRDVAVTVDETEVPAPPLRQADPQRGPLPLVFGQLDDPDLADPGDRRGTSVGGAVRYRDHLEGDLGRAQNLDDLLHVGSQPGSRVVERDDQAEVDLGRGELDRVVDWRRRACPGPD